MRNVWRIDGASRRARRLLILMIAAITAAVYIADAINRLFIAVT